MSVEDALFESTTETSAKCYTLLLSPAVVFRNLLPLTVNCACVVGVGMCLYTVLTYRMSFVTLLVEMFRHFAVVRLFQTFIFLLCFTERYLGFYLTPSRHKIFYLNCHFCRKVWLSGYKHFLFLLNHVMWWTCRMDNTVHSYSVHFLVHTVIFPKQFHFGLLSKLFI